jgi:hypothetical protein
MAEEITHEAQVPIIWVGTEETPIAFVNQFLAQIGQQDEVLLTFGQLTPPALMGEPEQIQKQIEQLSFVTTKAVARIGLTRTGLEELIRVLQETLRNHDQAQERKARLAREGDES